MAKKKTEIKVTWKYEPDPEAEARFWKLYFTLTLNRMAEDIAKKIKKKHGRGE